MQPEGAVVDVVIRQEAVGLRRGRAENGALAGVVALRSFSGARVQYVVRLADDVELVAEAPSSGPDSALAIGGDGLARDRSALGLRNAGERRSNDPRTATA